MKLRNIIMLCVTMVKPCMLYPIPCIYNIIIISVHAPLLGSGKIYIALKKALTTSARRQEEETFSLPLARVGKMTPIQTALVEGGGREE